MNIEWLFKNKFISFSQQPICTDYIMVKKSYKTKYAFIGEYDLFERPSGFVRCINQEGTIYEGNLTPDFKMNGFCITFNGHSKTISIGWYINNCRHGNWMSCTGDEPMAIIECGWYQGGQRI